MKHMKHMKNMKNSLEGEPFMSFMIFMVSGLVSLARELWRPLLEIRRNPFLGVGALEEQLLQFPLDGEALAESGFGARLHGAFDAAHGEAGFVRRRELLRVVEHRVEKRLPASLSVVPRPRARAPSPPRRPSTSAGRRSSAPSPCDFPTSRASRCVPPVPGSTPSATSGRPILPASFAAMRMSAAIATSRPPPTVWPFSAAMTSFGVCSRRFSVSLACRQK